LPTDTWKFASGTWTQLAPSSNPGGLFYPVMTYDTKDAYVLFFSGQDAAGHVHNATWKFVAGQWTHLTLTKAPGTRYAAGLTYDAKDGYAVLFGGTDGTATFKDTWNFTAGKWSKLAPAIMPKARSGELLAYSARDGKVVLFGGYDGVNLLSDSWTFAAGAWTKIWTNGHPSNRADMAGADGTSATSVVLFGGFGGAGVVNDTWLVHGLVWTHPQPRVPVSRSFDAMTYDEADGYVLLFGGLDPSTAHELGDTWKFAHGVWTPLHPATSPAPRHAAGMTYDSADGYVVLFGGYDFASSSAFGDTWTFLNGAWTQLSGTGPAARFDVSMTYDYADGYVLLFGGALVTRFLDTWSFSGGVWSQPSIVGSSPNARDGAAMAYDSADGYVLLFGGQQDTGNVWFDTWSYAAGTWTNLTGSVTGIIPVGVQGGAMVDDSLDGYVVLYGGIDSASLLYNDTFAYSGGVWTKFVYATNPGPDSYLGMAADPPDGSLVLFGGYASPSPGTWTY
ncbi:MAG: hypothetical protein L3K15_08305, partial [Thermoplasmata archaeon]|nr:hypothetical protein [Thermoplasmata archaeon]